MPREALLLAAGGTIAMSGERAVPALDAQALVDAVPGLAAHPGLRTRSLPPRPGAHLAPDDALAIARAALEAADEGLGVVVTHGTDTLEETAFLTYLMHVGDPPIVFTGAIRPASAVSADGPGNVLDAVAVARSPTAAGLGAVVCFGGEVHAAREARKADSTGPVAFGSPQSGPLGRVIEGELALRARPLRPAAVLRPATLEFHVPILVAALGDDLGALRVPADGAVVAALGAGHLSPAALAAVREAAARMPVVLALRPARGAFLRETYGFEGAEGDLRASGAVPAGALSPQAARIKLLACLGVGLRGDELAGAFAGDDR
jgi:L-asparaginase